MHAARGGAGGIGAIAGRIEAFIATLRYKIAASLIWLAGVYTTMLCVAGLFPDRSSQTVWGLALLVQFVLTIAQSDFWRGNRQWIASVAVIVDTAFNAAGLWPILRNLDQTPLWSLLLETGLPWEASGAVIFALTVGVSVFIAATPERLWR